MRKSLWIMLALPFLAIGPPDARANDSVVTLDVSGSLTPVSFNASCSPLPCTLGGDIVINNSTGAIISADVTMSGESPTVTPFTFFSGPSSALGQTTISFGDSILGNQLILTFATPTAGSLVNYDGGPVSLLLVLAEAPSPQTLAFWEGFTGSLTEVTVTPEPNSGVLWLLGVGLMFVMRKRIGRGLPQAS